MINDSSFFFFFLIFLTSNSAAAARQETNNKWRGSVGGIVNVPIASVWSLVSPSSRLSEWMPMVEKCTKLAGEEGVPGYTRLICGLMFASDDGDRSWFKERLILMDSTSYSYVYKMESSNVGLDGSMNTLRLVDYGEGSTLVEWEFQIDPMEGADKETVVDYLGFLYRSCINRIERAIEQATNKD